MFTGRFSSTAPALLVAVIASACGGGASFKSTAALPHPVSPRSPESVTVLASPPPAEVAVEVGRIKAASSSHAPTSDGKPDVLARLQKIAGENGCDAIVVSEPDEDLFATSNGTPLYRTHQSAVCFVNR